MLYDKSAMTDERLRRRRSRRRPTERKDRLIQTRVAEDLEQTLKREAARRRLTVSHLIRNTLEDAFNLVEDVTQNVGQLVSGSVELAAAVSRDARRIASIVRGQRPADEALADELESDEQTPSTPIADPEDEELEQTPSTPIADPEDEELEHVYGWNRVVANRESACSKCKARIARGDDALVGISDDSTRPRAWLCNECAKRL